MREPEWLEDEHGRVELASIATYGDVVHSFVERGDYAGPYLPGYVERHDEGEGAAGVGLTMLDHCVGNVELGKMDEWVGFYESVSWASRTSSTTTTSRFTPGTGADVEGDVGWQPQGQVPDQRAGRGRRKSQIDEYLEFNEGPGVQHIALQSEDIVRTVEALQERGVGFLETPDAYYEDVADRVGEIDEDWDDLRRLRILADRDEDGYLLQIFTKTVQDRPTLFFEVIERHGARLRRGQLQGAVRGDRARAGPARQPLGEPSRVSPQAVRRTALVSVAAACVLIALLLRPASPAARSACSPRRCTRAPTSSPRCSPSSRSASPRSPPMSGTSTGTGRPSTCRRSAEAAALAAVSVGVAGPALQSPVSQAGSRSRSIRAGRRSSSSGRARDRRQPHGHLLRTARRFDSAALLSNALHFGSDFAGSLAVLVGLVAVSAGWPAGDSVAALFVGALVLSAALRLMRRNVDVLMDRAPADAEEAAQRAIERIEPAVTLRRLRMRSAAGRQFADVVIGVAPDAAVGQGHAAADAVEDAVQRALPETDVVVHVEPAEEDALTRELAHAAAMRVPRVREIHNINVLHVDGRTEVSLHLKLPGELSLDEAHAVASEVEHAIEEALPGGGRRANAPRAAGRGGGGAQSASGRGRARRRGRDAHRSRARRALRRASCGSCRRKTDCSSSSPWGSTRPCRWRRHTRAPARSRSGSAAELPAISEIIVHTEP